MYGSYFYNTLYNTSCDNNNHQFHHMIIIMYRTLALLHPPLLITLSPCGMSLSGSVRTNNYVEGWHGWHSRLKKVVGKAHPNIFEIVEVFKKEQASTEVSLTQLSAGAAPPRRRRRVLRRDRMVTKLQQRFTSNSTAL